MKPQEIETIHIEVINGSRYIIRETEVEEYRLYIQAPQQGPLPIVAKYHVTFTTLEKAMAYLQKVKEGRATY